MKNLFRETWFLVIPGMLLLLAALRDLFSGSIHLRMDAAPAAAAGLAVFAGAYAFRKPNKFRGVVLIILAVAIALVFPNFIASDATAYVWLAVCFIFAAGAMYLSLTHRHI